jgi:cytochrome bd-type quinol oxidase subunit 1
MALRHHRASPVTALVAGLSFAMFNLALGQEQIQYVRVHACTRAAAVRKYHEHRSPHHPTVTAVAIAAFT